MEDDNNGSNPIHSAFEKNAPADVILKLVEVGGRELVLKRERHSGMNAVYMACSPESPSIDVILKLIELGGKESVLVQNNIDGRNLLHHAYVKNLPDVVLSKIIEVGGRDAVMATCNAGNTPLHYALESGEGTALGNAMKLIEIGGKELFTTENNDCRTAFQHFATLHTLNGGGGNESKAYISARSRN